MKTLFDLCKPRHSVFDETKREDVLNLSDLMDGRIDPVAFFAENYLTVGMNLLFETAFKRFVKEGATGVVKLTQAMGGGKTHNMLALGLLAMHPEYRDKIINHSSKYKKLGKVRVVAFSGRESDAQYGVWGSIAEQLGKKDLFQQYYSPLSAPGETAWINLLQGEPLLIMLDELPPYLENAKSKTIGNSDLCVVTTTALSNLFTALGKAQLSNVCLVITDLKATYESGSELIRSTFKELENEVNRSALNIEPVGSASDEVYYILKKRMFETIPATAEINQVAIGYKEAVSQAKQMGFTNMSPEHIYTGVKDSYPFHPSIKDLYARFKENPGFQQTRGLIRLMRQIIAQLYSGDKCTAKNKYLVNVFDFDLNDRAMLTTVTQIKQSLTNAISHDIAGNGRAVAEEIDSQYQQRLVQDVSKLILVASLADVPNALLGLTLQEIIGNLCEPSKDIAGLKKGLDEFQMRAWYLEHDKEGKLFFKNTKNMIAELHSLVESYDNEGVKSTTLKNFLEEKFKPTVTDCYQNVLIFPAVDDINLSVDKVTLVLFEPYTGGGLHPELKSLYDNALYKNRVLFLSGQRDTMNRLYAAAKELKAIERIIANMKEDKVPEDNQQYQLAQDTRVKKITAVLSAAQQTFSVIYYPNKNGIQSADFSMEFKGNNYNGEDQIRKILLEKQKLTDKAIDETFRKKCEDRLFTRKEMRWTEIRDRAATETSWQWHHPNRLNNLREDCISKDIWRERGDYLEKGPFPKEPTSLAVSVKNEEEETGKSFLKIRPIYGDKIYYEIGAPATTSSLLIDDPNHFETAELRVSFLCVDSSGDHPTGEPVEWRRDINVKYKLLDKADGQWLILKSQAGVKVKYTTDGSDPKENGGVYDGEFAIPTNTTFIQVVAEYEGEYFAGQSIKIDKKKKPGLNIEPAKELRLYRTLRSADTNDSYQNIALLKKYAESLADVRIILFKMDEKNNENGFIELTIDSKIKINPEQVEKAIDNLKDSFINNERANIEFECSNIIFKSGQNFYDWANEKKLGLSEFRNEEITQK
ncbi:DUF499 domain-containing protein [Bacteroides sp.]|uniref:DUF499 domain-containing protein n=1 Tax=Bacteroides sp. TaxID=29523 RepID=UPI00260997A5|nr:DUF499 domain-containing protein [Bacteroides sp.]MDD3040647.1 DUF499 domain-containing protein [Bacteroides sp.]